MVNDVGLLYIEPVDDPSAVPIIDDLTLRMTAALNGASVGTFDGMNFHADNRFRGWYTCSCGAYSSNCDYLLPNGEVVNNLCVHYLAHHRHEISESLLSRVSMLPTDHANPTTVQLRGHGTCMKAPR